MNILLIEPDYKNKYPPLGLMKLAYFHKNICHDTVKFAKGKLKEEYVNIKWDHIYVTSLFTFEWKKTIDEINYAKSLVDSIDKITVGGIAASLLPDDVFEETGIRPICGLLNEAGKLGLPGDECIDQMIPDYSILDDIDYVYPYHNAYFLSATKGCGMKCGFCAVQTLEPTYIPYLDIKEKIQAIDREFGPKKDLLLMDNNVLISKDFNKIIDDIIECGFGKGATYVNPRTKKKVLRYVDFNQGLDGNLLSEEKAKRLGEIAIKPARIAFDHIEDKEVYEQALRRCAKYGIKELSNYVLYNSEDFGGKGNKYKADTPQDLYNRMKITLDIKDEINKTLDEQKKVSAFSFPMRYIPLSAHERGYIGSQWNAKFLRAVQCMLIPTQGKGVGSRAFFETDFGKSSDEFIKFLCMPESLIAARGSFSEDGRGRKNETDEDKALRKIKWIANQEKILEWNRLFNKLSDCEKETFIALIKDNIFLPEKFFDITTDVQRKLYLFYLTTPRLIKLLGLIKDEKIHNFVYKYITNEFSGLYQDIFKNIIVQKSQKEEAILNFIKFFGDKEKIELIHELVIDPVNKDNHLLKIQKFCTSKGITYIDFECIRIYKRMIEMGIIKSHIEIPRDLILREFLEEIYYTVEKNYQIYLQKIILIPIENRCEIDARITNELKNYTKRSDMSGTN